jgi:hypothetical protein
MLTWVEQALKMHVTTAANEVIIPILFAYLYRIHMMISIVNKVPLVVWRF